MVAFCPTDTSTFLATCSVLSRFRLPPHQHFEHVFLMHDSWATQRSQDQVRQRTGPRCPFNAQRITSTRKVDSTGACSRWRVEGGLTPGCWRWLIALAHLDGSGSVLLLPLPAETRAGRGRERATANADKHVGENPADLVGVGSPR